MSIIRLPLLFSGSKGEKILYTLFDSGATFSCISEEHATLIGNPEKMYSPLELSTASSGNYLKIEYALRTDFHFEDIRLSDEFMVVSGLSEDCIIGVNTLQKWRIKLDYGRDTVIIDPKVTHHMLKDLKLM